MKNITMMLLAAVCLMSGAQLGVCSFGSSSYTESEEHIDPNHVQSGESFMDELGEI